MKLLIALLYVALPKLIAGGGQFAINLFLLRHFGPVEFGTLSVCLTGLLLFDSFLGSAIDMAVIRLAPVYRAKGDGERSNRIQNAALLLKPLLIGLFCIPLLPFRGRFSELLFQRHDFGYLIMLTMFALTSVLLLRSIQTHFQAEERFNWYGGTDFAHNALRYGFVAFALSQGFATPGLVLVTYALAPLVVGTLLLIGPAKSLLSVATTWASTKELVSVLRWFVPAAAVGGFTSRVDVFFVSHLSGIASAGAFAAAQAVSLPMLLLGTYLAVVFGPRIMPQLDDGTFAPFYRNFQLFILGLAVVSYGLLLSLRVWLPVGIFPLKFQSSWTILIVLFPSVLASLVSFPLTISLLLFLKPRFLFLVDACALPFLCAAYYLLGRKYGAMGIAAVTTAYSVLKCVVLQIAAVQVLKRQEIRRIDGRRRELEFSRG